MSTVFVALFSVRPPPSPSPGLAPYLACWGNVFTFALFFAQRIYFGEVLSTAGTVAVGTTVVGVACASLGAQDLSWACFAAALLSGFSVSVKVVSVFVACRKFWGRRGRGRVVCECVRACVATRGVCACFACLAGPKQSGFRTRHFRQGNSVSTHDGLRDLAYDPCVAVVRLRPSLRQPGPGGVPSGVSSGVSLAAGCSQWLRSCVDGGTFFLVCYNSQLWYVW